LEYFKRFFNECNEIYFNDRTQLKKNIENGISEKYNWGEYWKRQDFVPKTYDGIYGKYPSGEGYKIDFDPYNLTY
jgi:hypothetical protein